jgi:hypothetical protein
MKFASQNQLSIPGLRGGAGKKKNASKQVSNNIFFLHIILFNKKNSN